MDFKTQLGMVDGRSVIPEFADVLPVTQLKLMATGFKPYPESATSQFTELSADLIRKIQMKFRAFKDPLCPTDQRLQDCLDKNFGTGTGNARSGKSARELRLPDHTLHMDFHGLARTLSLPPDSDEFLSAHVKSYRIAQGVLHNPASDRRTTKGTFHVCQGGLAIPSDKKAVPKNTFMELFWHATNPPDDLKLLPFTSKLSESRQVKSFVSLLLRPRVSPEVSSIVPYQDMEIRFFAPASLVSNLDFVESIFGNAGDPFLPENDAGLDSDHFCGVSGMVLLAPHLTRLTKKELGLPKLAEASARQIKDGMCWTSPNELYNDGQAFKISFCSPDGFIFTLLADNYFGYCKKEVKAQISFATNVIGRCEEEHSGGALIFPSYNLGDFVQGNSSFLRQGTYPFAQLAKKLEPVFDLRPEGYGVDKKFPQVIYLPETADIFLMDQKISWKKGDKEYVLRLSPKNIYVYPSGYKIRMEKHPGSDSWRLIGTVAEGTFCHKPSTVSGGGKSEISKSVADGIIFRNIYVQDLKRDFKQVEKIIKRDYGNRFKSPRGQKKPSRSFLSPLRSLGSVVRLLTPSAIYSLEYNQWLRGIPDHVRNLTYLVKRAYRPEWGEDFQKNFSVDLLDGHLGNELLYQHRRLVNGYLKAGCHEDGTWMVFRLRADYIPADKLQMEDDITASIVIPHPESKNSLSQKFVENCEYRLFQRPDEAIHKGKDLATEADFGGRNLFISNFEPLPASEAASMLEHVIETGKFSAPMQALIQRVAQQGKGYFVSSDRPRMVNGKPSANVRYLQDRLDLAQPIASYVAQVGMRLARGLEAEAPILTPVQTILIGRRNNPPDHQAGITPLAVYNPLHYQDLPEAFMDFISSLTGKSPSTTGAGSEGALTKGPFNPLWAVHDLNNALVSYLLTGLQVFSTPAGHIGHKYQVGHDLSLLIPEIWARLAPQDRNAEFLIQEGYFSKVKSFQYGKKTIEANRLGYRMNQNFLHSYFGRVFSDPVAVFPQDMLEPEKQNLKDFVSGVDSIVAGHKKAALMYFEDGSVEFACPPLRHLLYIMAHGSSHGLTLESPEVRNLFKRESLIRSEWYKRRLEHQKDLDEKRAQKQVDALKTFMAQPYNRKVSKTLLLNQRLSRTEKKLAEIKNPKYLESLVGTLGADTLQKDNTSDLD